jgi:hypothetical protein
MSKALGLAAVSERPWDILLSFWTLERQDRRPNLSLVQGPMQKKALKTASKNRSGPLRGPNSML